MGFNQFLLKFVDIFIVDRGLWRRVVCDRGDNRVLLYREPCFCVLLFCTPRPRGPLPSFLCLLFLPADVRGSSLWEGILVSCSVWLAVITLTKFLDDLGLLSNISATVLSGFCCVAASSESKDGKHLLYTEGVKVAAREVGLENTLLVINPHLLAKKAEQVGGCLRGQWSWLHEGPKRHVNIWWLFVQEDFFRQ